jgi:hypothetical protein
MTELDMTTDVETADFTDELSDEALDREEGRFSLQSLNTMGSPVADR